MLEDDDVASIALLVALGNAFVVVDGFAFASSARRKSAVRMIIPRLLFLCTGRE